MSFQQGLSGLNSSSKALDVLGNNIANANTVGFKSAEVHFADVFANSLAGSGASQVGICLLYTSKGSLVARGLIWLADNCRSTGLDAVITPFAWLGTAK